LKVGNVPFFYLDLRRLTFWDPMLTRIRNRLSGWKSRFLSFGSRLVLPKSVLTSISMHVFAFSFFKAPSGTISTIDSILNKLFWDQSEVFRKTSWISWNLWSIDSDTDNATRHGHFYIDNVKNIGHWYRYIYDKFLF
jgi:hypothetical protein